MPTKPQQLILDRMGFGPELVDLEWAWRHAMCCLIPDYELRYQLSWWAIGVLEAHGK